MRSCFSPIRPRRPVTLPAQDGAQTAPSVGRDDLFEVSNSNLTVTNTMTRIAHIKNSPEAVQEIAREVERRTGWSFPEPPTYLRATSGKQIRQWLAEDSAEGETIQADDRQVACLIQSCLDFEGVYLKKKKALLLAPQHDRALSRHSQHGDQARAVAAHELVHALQDCCFPEFFDGVHAEWRVWAYSTDKLSAAAAGERHQSRMAFVEGHAHMVEQDFRKDLAKVERGSIYHLRSMPRYLKKGLVTTLAFPVLLPLVLCCPWLRIQASKYVIGAKAVRNLLKEHPEMFDSMYRHPELMDVFMQNFGDFTFKPSMDAMLTRWDAIRPRGPVPHTPLTVPCSTPRATCPPPVDAELRFAA